MKKIFFGLLALIISTTFLIKCTVNEENSTVSKENVLAFIKKDLASKKYYPNVKNKYDYSSANYKLFVTKNSHLFNNPSQKETGRLSITYDQYKNAIIDFYKSTEHDSIEIAQKFEYSKSLMNTYSNYHLMLDAFVSNGIIPVEEREIIDAYIDYFFSQEDYLELCQVTSTFIYYVNNSDFSEFEKRGMLTIFDTFKQNQKMFETNEQFEFLQFIKNNSSSNPSDRPSRDTVCGGRMVIGLVGGGLTGNGIGFLIGTAAAVFENWSSGCFD